MVVVWHLAYEVGWHPHNDPLAPDLDDELKNALGHYVYVTDVVPGKIKTLITLEAILASRTLYGSEKDGYVVKLREYARETLDNGITLLEDVCKKIDETEVLLGKKDFEVHMALPSHLLSPCALILGQEFKAFNETRQAIQDHVNTILHDLDLQPQTNSLGAHLYRRNVEPVAEVRNNLEKKLAEPRSDQSDSTYWQTLWQIVTHDDRSAKSLKGLRLLLQKLVLPDLQSSLDMSEKVQKFATEEEGSTPAFDHLPWSDDRQAPLSLPGIGTPTLGNDLEAVERV